MIRPLAVDIDGTMTRPDGGIDPRVCAALRDWEAPVVVATGKAFPYPVALCHFIGIPERVVAENGGIAFADGELVVNGDREVPQRVVDAFESAGHDLGWDGVDVVNRWRETEVAADRDVDESALRAIAAEHDLEVVDTGYAFHVKSSVVTKGVGLTAVARILDVPVESFVAIGDSRNDVELFEVAGQSFAVANADEDALTRANAVTTESFADGFLEALGEIRVG